GNIIYYLLIKSKRVIRSVLIFKVYNIIDSINLTYVILIILKRILNRLNFFIILTIVYTNSYLLYKYFIKLSITKKKRFIIDIIALR
ncbi:hypothetical protein CCUS01_07253, partial [Colletotrichum cuscutae]